MGRAGERDGARPEVNGGSWRTEQIEISESDDESSRWEVSSPKTGGPAEHDRLCSLGNLTGNGKCKDLPEGENLPGVGRVIPWVAGNFCRFLNSKWIWWRGCRKSSIAVLPVNSQHFQLSYHQMESSRSLRVSGAAYRTAIAFFASNSTSEHTFRDNSAMRLWITQRGITPGSVITLDEGDLPPTEIVLTAHEIDDLDYMFMVKRQSTSYGMHRLCGRKV